MNRHLIHLTFSFLLSPCLALANCDSILQTEFSRSPDDQEEGQVTDKIPIETFSLTAAYARGLFPWLVSKEGNGVWFSPPQRGILSLSEVNIPRSDAKAIRRLLTHAKYEVKYDTAFKQVITECAKQVRYTEQEINGVLTRTIATRWITDAHIEEYTKLHKAGHAHSVEVWEGDQLVGGLYGVFVNGYFSGESMFHKADDVTKLAYSALIDRLSSNGHTFIDTQQNLGLTKKWGGKIISRADFQSLLSSAQEANHPF